MPSRGGVPHPESVHDRSLLGAMIGNRLGKCLFVKLTDRRRQDPCMWGDKHFPGLHSDPETMQEAKVTLVCRNEDPSLCSGVLEVKRVIPLPQTQLQRCGDIMTVLREETAKG